MGRGLDDDAAPRARRSPRARAAARPDADAGGFRPTAYAVELATLLQTQEPEVWQFFADRIDDDQLQEEATTQLLRMSYRLDGDDHADLVDACATAAAALGVDVPVTLYQAEGDDLGRNAMAMSLPSALHVVFSGTTLQLLEPAEVLAVLGHEIAHHAILWTDGGRQWVLRTLVGAAAGDLSAAPSHVETDRLLSLHTEVAADRGALRACGDLHVAVASLVKMTTGLSTVSGKAFLTQADEVLGRGHDRSKGESHPETFLRAWALRRFAEEGDGADAEIAERLAGEPELERLDLLGQHRAAAGVRAVIDRFLRAPWAATDAVVGHARLFDPTLGGRTPNEPASPLAAAEAGLVELYAHVLLDLATVDESIAEPALAAAFVLSDELDIAKRFDAIVAKELGTTAKVVRERRAGAPAMLATAEASS